jgi:hypothetical protein
MAAVIRVAQSFLLEGYRVDILTEPSSFDVLAWKQGKLLFIEVKTGSPALTPNEKLFKDLVKSKPLLEYRVVKT